MPVENCAFLEIENVDAVNIDKYVLKRHHKSSAGILLLLAALLDKHVDITNTELVLPLENELSLVGS